MLLEFSPERSDHHIGIVPVVKNYHRLSGFVMFVRVGGLDGWLVG